MRAALLAAYDAVLWDPAFLFTLRNPEPCHFTVMMRWTGLAQWESDFPKP